MATLLAHELPPCHTKFDVHLPAGAFSSGLLTRVPRPALAPTLNSLLFLGGFLAGLRARIHAQQDVSVGDSSGNRRTG